MLKLRFEMNTAKHLNRKQKKNVIIKMIKSRKNRRFITSFWTLIARFYYINDQK